MAKVIGVDADPYVFVWNAAEVAVFEILAGISVNAGVGFGQVGAGEESITRGSRVIGVGLNDVHVGPERNASEWCGFSRGGDDLWHSHPQSSYKGWRCGDGAIDFLMSRTRN